MSELSPGVDALAPVERLSALEEVVGVVRHDVRNKLASVRNATFFLKIKGQKSDFFALDKRIPEFFALIESELTAADEMLGEHEGMKRIYARRAGRPSARAMVLRGIAYANVPPGIETRIDLGDAAIPVDAGEYTLAVRCIVDNAIDAMSGAGTLSIEGVLRSGAYVLTVSDTGPGLNEEQRSQAFRAFYTTKSGRAGLGLSMVRRIARRYRGDLGFAQAAAGTAVVLTIPTTE